MRVLILGPEWINDACVLHAAIQAANYHITEILIHGVTGVARLAEEWGKSRGIFVRYFPLDRALYREEGTFVLDSEMTAEAEAALIINDEVDKKLYNVMYLMRRKQKLVYLYRHPRKVLDF